MRKFIIIIGIIISSHLTFAQNQKESVFVYFKTNKYEIGALSQHRLDSMIEVFKKLKATSIEIYGHADHRGNDKLNDRLSIKRVNQVFDYLIYKGIDSKIIEKKEGLGKKQPKYDNNTKIGRRLNRRVEIIYSFDSKNLITDNTTEDSMTYVEPPRPEDTVIVGPKGTVMIIKYQTFAPIDFKDIKFEFQEYNDQKSMIENNIYTMSNDGKAMVGDGAVFIHAYYKGKEIQPKGSIYIAIPAKELVLENNFYLSDTLSEKTLTWKNGNMVLGFDSMGNTAKRMPPRLEPSRNYYFVSSNVLTGMMCGRTICDPLKPKSKKNKLIYKPNTFKLPKSLNNELYITMDNGISLIPANRINSNKFYFDPGCGTIKSIQAVYYNNGERMVMECDMKNVKQVKWRKLYKLSKNSFTPAKK